MNMKDIERRLAALENRVTATQAYSESERRRAVQSFIADMELLRETEPDASLVRAYLGSVLSADGMGFSPAPDCESFVVCVLPCADGETGYEKPIFVQFVPQGVFLPPPRVAQA